MLLLMMLLCPAGAAVIAVPAVMEVFCWMLLGPQGELGELPSPKHRDKRPKQAMRYIRSEQQLGSGYEMLMVW
jgi:hypothetical protein